MFDMSGKRRLIVITLTFLAITACGKGESVVGQPAPEFNIDLLKGGQIGITELRGKPVILYFFASW